MLTLRSPLPGEGSTDLPLQCAFHMALARPGPGTSYALGWVFSSSTGRAQGLGIGLQVSLAPGAVSGLHAHFHTLQLQEHKAEVKASMKGTVAAEQTHWTWHGSTAHRHGTQARRPGKMEHTELGPHHRWLPICPSTHPAQPRAGQGCEASALTSCKLPASWEKATC